MHGKIATDSRLEELELLMEHTPTRIQHELSLSHRPCSAEGIVFSKNRALQLHALLESYQNLAAHPSCLHILYDATSKGHEKAYDELFSLFDPTTISVYLQKEFRSDLLGLVDDIHTDAIFFLVDDIVFTRQLDMHDFCRLPLDTFVPSLRMGRNITRSHTGTKDLPLPRFITSRHVGAETFLLWKWAGGAVDWGFPLTLDGNLFPASEIAGAVRYLSFTSPNTFETNLQKLAHYYALRYGACAEHSKLMNVPSNRVQNDYNNMASGLSADELLDVWNQGLAIDWRALRGYDNVCPHELVKYTFVKRVRPDRKL